MKKISNRKTPVSDALFLKRGENNYSGSTLLNNGIKLLTKYLREIISKTHNITEEQ